MSHAFLPKGRHVLNFVEPESRTGATLLPELNGKPIAPLDHSPISGGSGQLALIWGAPRPPDARIAELGQGILAQLLGADSPASPIDHRIARAIAWAEAQTDKGLTMPEAASVACLSESRFSHLFSEETGLPFRNWVLWRRMMRAVQAPGRRSEPDGHRPRGRVLGLGPFQPLIPKDVRSAGRLLGDGLAGAFKRRPRDELGCPPPPQGKHP